MVFVRAMFSRKGDGPLAVEMPPPGADRPAWTKVAIIAAVGFVVGIVWPRLAGVRLGPSVPESTSAAASAAPPDSAVAAAAGSGQASAPVPAVAAVPAASPAVAASAAPSVALTVGHGVIFACKTADGDAKKGGECGSLPGLDGIVMPRLRKLAECPEAANNTGKMHLVVHVDFARGGVGVDLGRGNSVASPEALLGCAKTAIQGAVMSGVAHENPRYSIAYSLTFADGSGSAAGASATPSARGVGGDATPSAGDGTAQVVWEVAIVRDAPKTGKVIARLQRGTSLRVGAAKDGWFPVKYGDGFGSDGWVYRGAIGR